MKTSTIIKNMEKQMKAFHTALENNFPGIRQSNKHDQEAFHRGSEIKGIAGKIIKKQLLAEKRKADQQVCRKCGCTNDDCHQCIEKTGGPCYWVEEDLCSACATAKQKQKAISQMKKLM